MSIPREYFPIYRQETSRIIVPNGFGNPAEPDCMTREEYIRSQKEIADNISEQAEPAIGSRSKEFLNQLNAKRKAWFGSAACKGTDPEIFFSEDQQDIERAIEICQGCAVGKECLKFALSDKNTDGIWAGTTKEDRLKIIRQNNKRRLKGINKD